MRRAYVSSLLGSLVLLVSVGIYIYATYWREGDMALLGISAAGAVFALIITIMSYRWARRESRKNIEKTFEHFIQELEKIESKKENP